MNEHTNGLVRQYFPKVTDFGKVVADDVRKVENLLNNRPRAALGYFTPLDVFHGTSAKPSVALAS